MPILHPGYHVGIVVADLEKAMAELGKTGLEWHAPIRNSSEVFSDGTTTTITPWMVYSKQGPPYVELLELMPGTIWGETGLHHIGVWSEDVLKESERLSAEGIPQLISSHDNTVDAFSCYHQTSDGLRLELMDIGRVGPGLAAYLSGAADEYLNGVRAAELNGAVGR